MNKRFIFVSPIILITCLLSIRGQSPSSKQPDYPALYKKASQLYNLENPTSVSDSIAEKLFLLVAENLAAKNYLITIDSYIKAGNLRQGKGRLQHANELYHRAIDLNNRSLRNEALSYEAYLYLGSSHYFGNTIDSAQIYFEKASNIEINYTGRNKLPERDRLYNSIGAIFYESANYLQAKNYFQRALDFSDRSSTDYNEMYTGVQSNISNCLMKLHQYDSALRILQSLRPDDQQQSIIKQNIAHCYFELKLYDSALKLYQSLPLANNYASIVALTDMGRIYLNKKQWQQAEAVFDSAINRNRSISTNIKNKEEALAYLYRSQLAAEQGLLDEAMVWINEALQEVHLQFTWEKSRDLPESVAESVSPITLFTILHQKAKLQFQRYKLSKTNESLFAALATYLKAIETGNYIKLNFDNDEAKLFFNDAYRSIYEEAISVAHIATTINESAIDDFIFILENYKGNILYQNLQNVLSKSNGQIPDSIYKREAELKQLLAFYTSRINQNAGDQDALQLQNRLLSLQVELSRLQTTYNQYETYTINKARKSNSRLTLDSIRSKIDAKTSLINYFIAKEEVYCLVVTHRFARVVKIVLDEEDRKTFKNFVQQISHFKEGERYEGNQHAAKIYKWLIQPIEDLAGDQSQWVIVPDGFLYYLPFEALLKSPEKKDFLLISRAISYHYSFALALEEKKVSLLEDSQKQKIAFAPFAYEDSSIIKSKLSALPLSEQEVQYLTQKPILGKEATKENFLSNAFQYKTIHLATHASIGSDSNNNWIQFYPGDETLARSRLYVPEIYTINLHHTQLVVLSACETAGGITASGEGLLSLSRAFLYAGADGIVSTLWKTEDKVTSFLMQRMHEYIGQGHSVSLALKMAKIDLLNDNSIGSQYKSPNYWANFIYIGKFAKQDNLVEPWKLVFVSLFALALFWILLRWWNRKKTPSISR